MACVRGIPCSHTVEWNPNAHQALCGVATKPLVATSANSRVKLRMCLAIPSFARCSSSGCDGVGSLAFHCRVSFFLCACLQGLSGAGWTPIVRRLVYTKPFHYGQGSFCNMTNVGGQELMRPTPSMTSATRMGQRNSWWRSVSARASWLERRRRRRGDLRGAVEVARVAWGSPEFLCLWSSWLFLLSSFRSLCKQAVQHDVHKAMSPHFLLGGWYLQLYL